MSVDKIFQLLERVTCHGFYTITGKYQEQSAILQVSVNMAVLRIVIIVRFPELGNTPINTFKKRIPRVPRNLCSCQELEIIDQKPK